MIVSRAKAEEYLGKKLEGLGGRKRSYYVLTKDGSKNLGGPYTKEKAKERLKQVETFKRMGNPESENPRKRLYIKPSQSAIRAARRGLEARRKAPRSKKGGLSPAQAHQEGVGSGVARARDIAAGKKVNAYQVKAFFDRHRGNYLDAKKKGLKAEESKIIQAWLLWGGEPLRKQATKAVERDKTQDNPSKPFFDRKHDWKEILIAKDDKQLTRKQILEYYKKNEKKIWPYLENQTVMVILAIKKNQFIRRRHGPDGKFIKLTKLKGPEDPRSFEYWILRRTVEFHPTLMSKVTPILWLDLDMHSTKNKDTRRRLIAKMKRAVPHLKMTFRKMGVKRVHVYSSGTSGGIHLEGNLAKPQAVDPLRKRFVKLLAEMFREDKTFTTGVAKPGQIRLDVTTLHRLGSLRAPYSMTTVGYSKKPIRV